jgi:hypothetical protein
MDNKIIELAAQVLGISIADAAKNSKPLLEIDATYFWKPTRGGGSVIINANCEKLATGSAISFETHMQAFQDGRRN